MQNKVCTKCGKEKEIIEFHKQTKGKFGVSSNCKECRRTPNSKQKEARLVLVPTGFKLCSKCNKIKLISLFSKDKTRKDGLHSKCKDCDKKYCEENKELIKLSNKNWKDKNKDYIKIYNRINKYGVTLDQYNQMLEQQNNVCAICGKPETIIDKRVNRTVSLAVDHNHQTNKVRGLLCVKCNSILGLANDNIELLQKSIEYLRLRG